MISQAWKSKGRLCNREDAGVTCWRINRSVLDGHVRERHSEEVKSHKILETVW